MYCIHYVNRAAHPKVIKQYQRKTFPMLEKLYLFPVRHPSTAVDRVPVLQAPTSRCHLQVMSHQPVAQVNRTVKAFPLKEILNEDPL